MPEIEVLAPVGNRAMLNAALAAGADAVYLGGKTGNARAFAGNFDEDALRMAVRDAHLCGAGVYLTLNTLVKAQEMDEILRFADTAVEADIDAVILQDLGLARALKSRYPDLPLHASTQMNVHSLAGVRAMETLGFERIIAGRETTLEELARMRDHSSMEVELFVHGSLCASLSGQCLLSGLIGGRSGNRGRCAQPCRKRYTVSDGPADTLLSLRDLNTLAYMDTWRKLGIRSLKIEGRMKKPEYVYAVTCMVRAALRGETSEQDLADVSSRAFTKGFTLGDFGAAVAQRESTGRGTEVGRIERIKNTTGIRFSAGGTRNDTLQIRTVRDRELTLTATSDYTAGSFVPLSGMDDAQNGSPVRRLYAARIEQELSEAESHAPAFALTLHFSGGHRRPAELVAESEGRKVRVQTEIPVQAARSRPVTIDAIREKLAKTGTTVFPEPSIHIVWEDDLFLPLGEVSRLRKHALERLTHLLARRYDRQRQQEPPVRTFSRDEKPVLHIETDANKQAAGLAGVPIHRVYTSDREQVSAWKDIGVKEVYGILPEPADQTAETYVQAYGRLFDGLLVKDLAGAVLAVKAGLPVQFDASVHCMNDRAVDLLADRFPGAGISASIEMSGKELANVSFVSEAEVTAFGPVVAMKLRHCPFAASKGCTNDQHCSRCAFSEKHLTDEHGENYYVERADGLSLLYYSRVLDRIDSLAGADFTPAAYRLILREDPANRAICAYAYARLIARTPAGRNPVPASYWQTRGKTDGRWIQGVV